MVRRGLEMYGFWMARLELGGLLSENINQVLDKAEKVPDTVNLAENMDSGHEDNIWEVSTGKPRKITGRM